uniref:AlNc14C39G3394 protein n=1 Tax=Albugo laibachii Nc14 TaxID=890382 RepID=F0W9D2_9STRA|nr:AlNc14C39G3394 [Albugo laibachii Nc14]|eukprot:CCA17745.1 AlNc14C39G3394 [Albugo laibachii Nc14]
MHQHTQSTTWNCRAWSFCSFPRIRHRSRSQFASFKRRYRHRQLQNALDLDEQGSQADIDMIDQLTAMKRIISCWREAPSEVILNCFRYTGLVLGHTTTRRSQIDADEQLNIHLLVQMEQLCIRDPMYLDDFICFADEVET